MALSIGPDARRLLPPTEPYIDTPLYLFRRYVSSASSTSKRTDYFRYPWRVAGALYEGGGLYREYQVVSRRIAQMISDSGTRLVVFPTADNFGTNFPIVRDIASLPNTSGVNMLLRFVNSEELGIRRWIREFDKNRGILNRLHVAVETETLRREFPPWMRDDIKVIHYPGSADTFRSTSPVGESKRLEEPGLRLGMLGAPTGSKGYLRIPAIVEALDASELDFRFVAQCFDDEIAALLENHPRCQPLPAILAANDLQSRLAQLDALVLPYSSAGYNVTFSAMVYEAMDQRIPVIVPANTSLGQEVGRFGIGVTFEAVGEIGTQVRRLLDPQFSCEIAKNIDEFNARRLAAARDWLALGGADLFA